MSLALSHAVPAIPVAALEATVVMLPRRTAFRSLSRLRAPAWAAILPGIILAGTFGPITLPSVARALALGVAFVSPVVALAGALSAVRIRLLGALLVIALAAVAIAEVAPLSQLGFSLVTALACTSVGVALNRLIPRAWLAPGVLAMSVLDVALLATGIGVHQDLLLAAASRGLPGFALTGVQLGGVSIGYPDLFLAGLLGAAVAPDGRQAQAAGAVFVLTLALETLLVPGEVLPATLPLALTLLLTSTLPAVDLRFRRPGLRSQKGEGAAPLRAGGARATQSPA